MQICVNKLKIVVASVRKTEKHLKLFLSNNEATRREGERERESLRRKTVKARSAYFYFPSLLIFFSSSPLKIVFSDPALGFSIPRPSFDNGETQVPAFSTSEIVVFHGCSFHASHVLLRRSRSSCSRTPLDSEPLRRFSTSQWSQYHCSQDSGEVSVEWNRILLQFCDWISWWSGHVSDWFEVFGCRSDGNDGKGEPWSEVISWEPRAFVYHNFLVSLGVSFFGLMDLIRAFCIFFLVFSLVTFFFSCKLLRTECVKFNCLGLSDYLVF